MCGKLDSYLLAFAKLRVDRSNTSWSILTNHCSPYKPILLLSILDHIASGRITTHFIEPSFELTETFQNYISLLPDAGRKASMSLPFYHLESSGFWELIPQSGQTHRKGLSISSMKRLREIYLGARISKDLFMLLQMEHSREKLRSVLIEKFFAPEAQKRVKAEASLNSESDKYSLLLLKATEAIPSYESDIKRPDYMEKVRGQGFRKAIVQLYDHRCAFCGIKMRTPEGHTVVDAAHIKPWSVSQNDHPSNGVALCKLCHWSFDEGLMTLNTNYHVLISPAVLRNSNLPGHIMTLSDRPMFKPPESKFWPDIKSIAWHRTARFQERL
jgi:putative restriction endonuclease